jgi:hypothetical protein
MHILHYTSYNVVFDGLFVLETSASATMAFAYECCKANRGIKCRTGFRRTLFGSAIYVASSIEAARDQIAVEWQGQQPNV